MASNILFLTLRIFSATGGIEKVCKVVCLALHELTKNDGVNRLKVLSMYDCQDEVEEKYLPGSCFEGFKKKKLRFVFNAVQQGVKADIVLLSHINLLSIGYLIKSVSPKTKIVLFTHGIEVWGTLSAPRKKMLATCTKILAVSRFTRDSLIQQQDLLAGKIEILNNCLDPFLPTDNSNGKSVALQKRYGFSDGQIILMTLTRLSSRELYKGYDNVLLAITQLRKNYPHLKYLIVGKYDAEEKGRLDKIIKQHALEDNVVFTGFIPDEELATHYKLADIYVMPSKKEGFGIVFIEAMHYGLPVIAGNKDGSADALCDGKLGILVDPDIQQEINEAIEKMIQRRQDFMPDKNLLDDLFSYNTYKKNLQAILAKL